MTVKAIVAVDVDEVCADLLGRWLNIYNEAFGDTLLPEDVTDWDLKQFVKPEAKEKIYGYLNWKHLYQDILPIEGARTATQVMRKEGYRVVFVTTCVPGTEAAKRDWLVKWGFLPEDRTVQDFVATGDKSLIRADFLFDDRVENVKTFRGEGVIVTRAHNRWHNLPRRIPALSYAPDYLARQEGWPRCL